MPKFFGNYPFKKSNIKICEGFSNVSLGPGGAHFGIDYRLVKGEEFASFQVFSMFEGHAKFGVSDLLGKYFSISLLEGDFEYEVVYGHLDLITEDLQKYAIIQGDRDFIIPAGYPLGWAGKTGHQKTVRQLHLEVYEKKLMTREIKRIDPYGIYGKQGYLHPGTPLTGLSHMWTTDNPPFAEQ